MQQLQEPQTGEVQQQPARATATTSRPQMMQQQQQLQRPQECGVCLFVYEEQDHRPRTLPCGHTFCSLCVAVLLEDGRLTCPSCRTDHLAPDADHFPISYGFEAMVKELQAAMEGASAAAGEASLPAPRDSQDRKFKRNQKAAAGLSRKLQSMIQDQQTSMGSLAATLQKELDQLSQYRAQLALSRAEHGSLLEELDKLAQQHRAAIELLQEEDVRVEAFVEEGQEVQREVRAAQGQLQQVSTPQQAFSTIDAADHTTVEAEEWLQHSREKIPNSTALSTSSKEVEATKAALKAARAVAGVTPHQDPPASGHLHCTIMEAVDRLKAGPPKYTAGGASATRGRFGLRPPLAGAAGEVVAGAAGEVVAGAAAEVVADSAAEFPCQRAAWTQIQDRWRERGLSPRFSPNYAMSLRITPTNNHPQEFIRTLSNSRSNRVRLHHIFSAKQ